MNEQEKKFKDGFNSGYLLAQYEPELLKKILSTTHDSNPNSEYISGLTTGHDRYIIDKIMPSKQNTIKGYTPNQKNPEHEYLKGFNSGYLLSKHEPELAKKLITPQNKPTDYHKGLTAGKKEHEIEKTKERLKGITPKNMPSKEINKSRGKGK